MSSVNNFMTRFLKHNTFYILLYVDFNQELNQEIIVKMVTQFIIDNPIYKEDNMGCFTNIDGFIQNHVLIKYVDKHKFNNYIGIINNQTLSNSFFLLCCIDNKNKRSRMYFRFNHAYTDGYNLIKITCKSFINTNYVTPKFTRHTNLLNTVYYYTIGTIMLFVVYLKIWILCLFNIFTKPQEPSITDYIICKPFNLNKIKTFCKNNHIHINDFLYSVMVKTDKLYTNKPRNILIGSPFNITKTAYTNNMLAIVSYINNSLDNNRLLRKVHSLFNNFKYSLFIPILSCMLYITEWIPIHSLSYFCNSYRSKLDYIYTNMIGPSFTEINNNSENLIIQNINFLCSATFNAILYNIISSDTDINIICSFKKGIINKKRFKKCMYKAYKSLIKTTS